MDKYQLYERSVQSPSAHLSCFLSIYQDIYHSEPRRLREDFCGTFILSCAWVKRSPRNYAWVVDLDPEPLEYGKKNHWQHLSQPEQKRLSILKRDVLLTTQAKVDLVVACNFSFFIFKERKILLQYFSSCLKSLRNQGVLILEMAGGPGMITSTREQKTVKDQEKFVYIWDQKSFDPITHDAKYSIHFKLANGTQLKNAFNYHWRLWTIPEVRDLLEEAGFKRSIVYWESTLNGEGTGEYVSMEQGDNAYSWIAYIVGVP